MHFTDANFEQEVIKSNVPVMVDFYAEWCGPCKLMAPSIEKLAAEYEGKFKIGKFDTEENPTGSEQFEIRSIPTLIFFVNGQVVQKEIGFKSEEDLRKFIESHLAAK